MTDQIHFMQHRTFKIMLKNKKNKVKKNRTNMAISIIYKGVQITETINV